MLRTPCGGPLCTRFLYMGFRPLKKDKVINTPGGNESSTPLEVRLYITLLPRDSGAAPVQGFPPCAVFGARVQCTVFPPPP